MKLADRDGLRSRCRAEGPGGAAKDPSVMPIDMMKRLAEIILVTL